MNVTPLTPLDLIVAAVLVGALVLLSFRMRLDLERRLITAALRTTIQLLLIGFTLKALFDHTHPAFMGAVALVMLTAAGREAVSRQKRRFTGWWSFGIGGFSMFVSSFAVTVFALVVIIGNTPWYAPQYAIPLLGMLLGNTMNGISLGLDRLTDSAYRQRHMIEGRLLMGEEWSTAVQDIQKDSIRTAMIPIINAMASAGLVSLPGMMTGQILAGSPPIIAVQYQVLIMFLISTGTGFGAIVSVRIGCKRLFDDRARIRMDRLKTIT